MARADQPDRQLMLLGLSTDAAPRAHPVELAAACGARGLTGLEVRLTVHADVPLDDLRRACEASSVRLVGLLTQDDSHLDAAASLSRAADAPLIVATDDDPAARIDQAREIARAGGRALPLLTGPAKGWLHTVHASEMPFAWQIDDRSSDPAGDVEQIVSRGAALHYIRLAGGGPETAMHEGRGIGPLMRGLTLAGYGGPVVMMPSSASYHVAWSMWLGRRGGWGCGSMKRAPSPLPLQEQTTLPSNSAGAA